MASGSGSGRWSEDLEAEAAIAMETTDVELLKRAWRNEKAAPEILQFEAALVLRAREQIQLLVILTFTLIPTLHMSSIFLVKQSASVSLLRDFPQIEGIFRGLHVI